MTMNPPKTNYKKTETTSEEDHDDDDDIDDDGYGYGDDGKKYFIPIAGRLTRNRRRREMTTETTTTTTSVSTRKKMKKDDTTKEDNTSGSSNSNSSLSLMMIRSGSWDENERLEFLRAYRFHGHGRWKEISAQMKTRYVRIVKYQSSKTKQLFMCDCGSFLFGNNFR